ncbi:TPA: hypothetical protein ACI7B7_005121, partial [Escherichia coli]
IIADSPHGLAGQEGIGEPYQSVPAYAGLRRFYSGITCNHSVPPSMPLTRHKSLFLSETKKHAERVVTW